MAVRIESLGRSGEPIDDLRARVLIGRAQHAQVVPLAPLATAPLQQCEVAAPRSAAAHLRVMWAWAGWALEVGCSAMGQGAGDRDTEVDSGADRATRLVSLRPPSTPARAHLCVSAHCTSAEWPARAATAGAVSSQSQPCVRAHCSTSRWPPAAAAEHVSASHGAPCARAHASVLRCPPLAAARHVSSSHGQPSCLTHCSISRFPILAAPAHVRVSQGQPSLRAHCSSVRWPPTAASRHTRESHRTRAARSPFTVSRSPLAAASSIACRGRLASPWEDMAMRRPIASSGRRAGGERGESAQVAPRCERRAPLLPPQRQHSAYPAAAA